MATEIKLRRGTKAQHDDGSGFTGALGEVTVDTTDDTLRVHDGSLKGGHVMAKLSDVEASDTLAELLAKGNSTGSNDIQVDATDRVTFGAESGGKLEIYEDGSQNGIIKQTGTGALKISGIYGTLNNDSDQELISWDADNAGLSWRGNTGAGLKLFTKETGIGVTGTVDCDGVKLGDNEKIQIGNTQDLELFHDGINSYMQDAGDGGLILNTTSGNGVFIHSATETMGAFHTNGAVNLYHNNVEKFATTETGIDVTGTVTADGVLLGDNDKLQLGAEQDLLIFHNGNHSYIKDQGDGILSIQTNGDSITLHDSANARDMAKFYPNGRAALHWAGGTGTGAKLETTATGIDVTGTVTADGVKLGDNEKIQLGDTANPDLEIYHNGSHSVIEDVGTGNLIIRGANIELKNASNKNKIFIHNGDDGSVKISHGDAEAATLETTSTGIDVTGLITADGVHLADDKKLTMGTSDDFRIYKNASGNAIIHEGGSGNLEIRGESGTLRNNANETCLGWNADKAYLYWQGDTGTKGERLKTTDTGIDVTGTVNADLVKLNPTGGASEGGQIEFERAVDNQTAWYVDVYGSSTDTSLRFVDNNDANNPVNRVLMTNTGIDVTGKIECDTSLQIQSSGSSVDAMPDLYMTNIETAADAQNLGMISFRGYNDASTPDIEGYANIYAQQVDVSEGAEKGKLVLQARNGAGYVEALEVNKDGIDVTGTVEADAFSGTSDTAITDFVTSVSTNDNDTTVPTTAAVKSYVDNNDGDTTYTGGTGLTLDGTTFNVDAAQTQITSVGTLSGLTTGATTVNGTLSVNSLSEDNTYSPEIVLERNGGAAAGDDSDKLGVITFKGDNTDGTQSVYAQIGARIVDDGADNTNTKGEIRISCGYHNLNTLEDPSLRIDHLGTWINEHTPDGSPAGANFYNVSKGEASGIKYWASSSSGYATEVKAATPTADRDIKFPDVSGFVVVSGVAGGSMNGGGGLSTAQTAWSPEQFMANANTDYYHYTDASTDVDLLVAVPFAGVDLGEFGAKYTFRNISANANSKITIDLDGFTSVASQGLTQYYSINKYDGSTPSLITSANANLVISAGGVIEMSAIAGGVFHVTGTGFA